MEVTGQFDAPAALSPGKQRLVVIVREAASAKILAYSGSQNTILHLLSATLLSSRQKYAV
jgi:hypothetical protein